MPTRLPDDVPRCALIEGLAGRLARHPAVDRVWLFGSRARGDNFERSDIDLAIEPPSLDRNDWLKIKLDFEDEAPTLLLIDLIRFEDAPEHLREQIRDEGIVIYERARSSSSLMTSTDRWIGWRRRSASPRPSRLRSTGRFHLRAVLENGSGSARPARHRGQQPQGRAPAGLPARLAR
jgi:predicted nucleotidyltransferase